ncbi:hypothetical protein OHA79_50910 (plasmid) [Streptomyces sp. NBC_00841]|uniref:hypothetical protein n=1 Tax=unclassified Streptomyces TaxID=2593676 RepID=UPI00225225B0|nr:MULTISPECIES: hypothetical protein [unclassified Streptomyces]MCX4538434.1 hypothetical protein [Streptomyces sp. NBC_01669]WSA05734.1 hypothetical protein OHA79_50910 [Streptomyces sp. NBC_00841]
MTTAEQELPQLLADISEASLAADPLMIYSSMHVLNAISRAVLPARLAFGSDALAEFYGGLVTAMPPEDVLAQLGTEYHPQVLYDVDSLLREYGKAESLAYRARMLREGTADQQTNVLHMLQLERRFDRMQGYPAQLRPIFDGITAPLASKSRKVLGFSLHHAADAADAYHSLRNTHINQALDALQDVLAAAKASTDKTHRSQLALVHSAGVATFGAAPVEDDLPGLLAERLNAPHNDMTRLVASLTTQLGSQPDLRELGDTNALRRRPIIGLGDTRALWARPGDFLHEALDWAADACLAHPELLKQFDKRRQDFCEEQAHRTLAAVFGHEYTHAGVIYPEAGNPDVDVLVAMPGAVLAVEAKGGRFTDPARRAAPDRVQRKTREFVDKALTQNARTVAYLDRGGRDFRDQHKRRLPLPDPLPTAVSVIVTLDRVDPFATLLPDGGKRDAAPEEGTWLVTLADLMTVAEILRHPAEFYAYARTRAAMAKVKGPTVFVEADALAVWLEHRVQPVEPCASELVYLDTSSEAINAFYTHVDAPGSPSPSRPASGIPSEVLDALDLVQQSRPEDWRHLAIAALAVKPAEWQPLRRALHPTKPGSSTRRDRKRARRAADGIRLSPHLTVYVCDSLNAPPPPLGPATLLITPPRQISNNADPVAS